MAPMELHDSTHHTTSSLLRNAALETLWPTRCTICDSPGDLLCESCYRRLPFIDYWQACPRCGAPAGRIQCCTCNPVSLSDAGLEEFPFNAAASALLLSDQVRRIVASYKDRGEQRLARTIAAITAAVIPPLWVQDADALTFIPSSSQSFQKRGFDHAEMIAQELAAIIHVPCIPLFLRPHHQDQRMLSRAERLHNLNQALRTAPFRHAPETLIIFDDVFTTGSTLCCATQACKEAGAQRVYCATFARAFSFPT